VSYSLSILHFLKKKRKIILDKKTFFIPGNTYETSIMQQIIASPEMRSKKGIFYPLVILSSMLIQRLIVFFQGFSISIQELQQGKKD
jgi:hypothetical protein